MYPYHSHVLVLVLEFSADVRAHVVGKPEKEFFLLAQAELGPAVAPAETLMVGDDVRFVFLKKYR
jgi:ribonucleotide monophosphatase NagD (HAD superfamily)